MPVLLDTNVYTILEEASSREPGITVSETDFGDGYGQSIVSGINAKRDTWRLVFAKKPRDLAYALAEILRNSKNGAANMLKWTPPGESTEKYWTASQVKEVPSKGKWKVSCTLRQEFPLTV